MLVLSNGQDSHPGILNLFKPTMLGQVQQCFVKLCFDIKTKTYDMQLKVFASPVQLFRLLEVVTNSPQNRNLLQTLRASYSYMWPHIMAAGLVIEQQENPRFEKLFKWLKNTQPYPAIIVIVLESNTHQKWRNEWRRHSSLDFVIEPANLGVGLAERSWDPVNNNMPNLGISFDILARVPNELLSLSLLSLTVVSYTSAIICLLPQSDSTATQEKRCIQGVRFTSWCKSVHNVVQT